MKQMNGFAAQLLGPREIQEYMMLPFSDASVEFQCGWEDGAADSAAGHDYDWGLDGMGHRPDEYVNAYRLGWEEEKIVDCPIFWKERAAWLADEDLTLRFYEAAH